MAMSSYWSTGRQHIQTSTYVVSSHHPLQRKLSVIRTLLDRNKNIIMEEEDRKQEEHHIQRALTRCGYPDWSIKRVERHMDIVKQKKVNRKAAAQLPEVNRATVVIPYVHGLLEAVTQAYRRRISSAMKPF